MTASVVYLDNLASTICSLKANAGWRDGLPGANDVKSCAGSLGELIEVFATVRKPLADDTLKSKRTVAFAEVQRTAPRALRLG